MDHLIHVRPKKHQIHKYIRYDYPKEAASSSVGTEYGSSPRGKRALQIVSYWPEKPSLSPSIFTCNIKECFEENN